MESKIDPSIMRAIISMDNVGRGSSLAISDEEILQKHKMTEIFAIHSKNSIC